MHAIWVRAGLRLQLELERGTARVRIRARVNMTSFGEKSMLVLRLMSDDVMDVHLLT